ncbi:predicted protein [Naegleria gruberi]|uniref:UDP-N-acetylglucosamine transferase subunit ALG14 n=1 Tax=Naegleria gruberi TaxID=5762 RepID=D2VIR4_NAEGR|nr:uncharacterized protein NAEGRDRAFT_34380 [Naegleria gruberi]EFC43320.1 predicted protein [Naegleria gruberi]|eukprot:XP_002676064.1 predicted protein [Naegleria gruberi strain NEG-M]
MILPKRIKEGSFKLDKSNKKLSSPSSIIKTLVVLGSGGHTGEMMDVIQTLDPKRYKLEFVLADTDSTSEKFVRNLLKDKTDFEPLSFHYIPRSREVHQSYFTSIFTTLKALFYTTVITNVNINPDLIIVNGPGTCIPVCLSAYLTRFLGIKHVKIIFIESVCRVESLSASGKIMYLLADRFLVHWPQLQHKYKNVEYHGRMCY